MWKISNDKFLFMTGLGPVIHVFIPVRKR